MAKTDAKGTSRIFQRFINSSRHRLLHAMQKLLAHVLILAVFFPASLVFAGNIQNRCPEVYLDAGADDRSAAYMEQIGVKKISDLDPFQLLLRGHYKELEKRLNAGFDINACGGPLDSSLLGLAASVGFMDGVKILAGRGANLNLPKNSQGQPPLVMAIYTNQYQVSDYLIQMGADVKIKQGAGDAFNTLDALTGAMNNENRDPAREVKLARELMARGVSPNEKDVDPILGMTPLIGAIVSNRPALVKLFLENGADPAIRDRTGRNAFDIAKAMSNRTVGKKMLAILEKSAKSTPR